MSLIPLLFGAPQRRRYNEDPFALMVGSRYDTPHYIMDPFIDINSALADMDHAMRYVNREMGRLSNNQTGGQQQLAVRNLTPDIIEEDGQKKIQFNFDVRGFKPEDITLKTQDGRLVVSAKHEEGDDEHHVVRQFQRMVSIPEGAKVELLKSRLGRGGVLQVEAPYTAPAIEQKKEEFREIPITHEKPKAVEQAKK
ncbi:heat shock protein beta-1-like [Paramacrobiotus metropolitanus]|uniref:heat shock protein beta-1-like n=1 Tax=Paramacrobiotus metropolitanus TaxID=2943436 RepID=UPI002445E359|nr:heat shock protein beta-1-like [Paramacrobiotus metropolitanus]